MSEWDSLPSTFSSLCQWSDSDLAVHLKDFSARYALPNIIKVTKGQYRNIGVAKSVYNELYLHSIQTTPKVYAEGIKVKEGRRSIGTVEQRYAIPLSYEGWFELLSEDGRAVAPFYSVAELQQAFPGTCLVRESVKAFLADEAGQISLQQPCVISIGEQLTLIRNMSLPTQGLMGSSKKNYLCCKNKTGDMLFVPSDQKGLFSPIAGQGNISGVHNIKGLLEKFRMPFKVRLVHGVVPGKMDRSFTGCFRFVSVFSDETAFICPLKKDAKLVPVSLKEALKVVPVQNFDELRIKEECRYYDERSSRMTGNYLLSIHLLVAQPDMESVQKGQQELKRSLSASDAMTKSKKNQQAPEEDMLFSEIDEIYQYVRQGGVPPLPRSRPKSEGGTTVEVHSPRNKGFYKNSRSPPRSKDRQQRHAKQGHTDDEHYWEDPVYADITVFQKKPRRETDPRHKGKVRPRSKSETTLTTLAGQHNEVINHQSASLGHTSFDENAATIIFDPEPASDSDSALTDNKTGKVSSGSNAVKVESEEKPCAPPVESIPTRSPLERSNSRSASDNKPSMSPDNGHLSEKGKGQTEYSPQQNDKKQEPKGTNVMNIKRTSGPVANLRQLYKGFTSMKSNKDKDTEGNNTGGVVSQSYRKLSDTIQPRHSSSAEELSDKTPAQILPQSLSSPALSEQHEIGLPEEQPSTDDKLSPDIRRPNSLSLPVSTSPDVSPGSKSPSLSKGSPVNHSISPVSSPPSPNTSSTPSTPSPESTTTRPDRRGERIIYGENDMLYKPLSPSEDGPERLVYGVTAKSSFRTRPEVLVYGQNINQSKYGGPTQSAYNLFRKPQDHNNYIKQNNGDRVPYNAYERQSHQRAMTASGFVNRANDSNTIQVYNHYLPPRVTSSHDGSAKALNPGYNERSSLHRSTPLLFPQYQSPSAAISVAGNNTKHPGYVAVARVDRDSGYGAPSSESPTHYEFSYNSLDRNMYNLHL